MTQWPSYLDRTGPNQGVWWLWLGLHGPGRAHQVCGQGLGYVGPGPDEVVLWALLVAV